LFLSENMVSWKKVEEDHQILYPLKNENMF
jgi:hypothetical protein